MATSTTCEGGTTAATSWEPALGDITEAASAVFTVSAFGDVTLSTASEGWAEIGSRARVRHQTNPVSGAAVKAVQHQFAADDPDTANALVIDASAATTFAGHLLMVSA
jgi:hypothetical protein